MAGMPIALNEKARKRVQNSLDAITRIQENTSAYLEGLASALDVPEGYTFDQSAMAFVPPQVAPPVQSTPSEFTDEDIRDMMDHVIEKADGVLDNGVVQG